MILSLSFKRQKWMFPFPPLMYQRRRGGGKEEGREMPFDNNCLTCLPCLNWPDLIKKEKRKALSASVAMAHLIPNHIRSRSSLTATTTIYVPISSLGRKLPFHSLLHNLFPQLTRVCRLPAFSPPP